VGRVGKITLRATGVWSKQEKKKKHAGEKGKMAVRITIKVKKLFGERRDGGVLLYKNWKVSRVDSKV